MHIWKIRCKLLSSSVRPATRLAVVKNLIRKASAVLTVTLALYFNVVAEFRKNRSKRNLFGSYACKRFFSWVARLPLSICFHSIFCPCVSPLTPFRVHLCVLCCDTFALPLASLVVVRGLSQQTEKWNESNRRATCMHACARVRSIQRELYP